jgi:hypothetical protein
MFVFQLYKNKQLPTLPVYISGLINSSSWNWKKIQSYQLLVVLV